MKKLVLLFVLLCSFSYSAEDLTISDISEGSIGLNQIVDLHVNRVNNQIYVVSGSLRADFYVSIYQQNPDGSLTQIVQENLSSEYWPDLYNQTQVSSDGGIIYLIDGRRNLVVLEWDKINNTIEEVQSLVFEPQSQECRCSLALSNDDKTLYYSNNFDIKVLPLSETGVIDENKITTLETVDPDNTGLYIQDMGFTSDGSILHVMRRQALTSYKRNSEDGLLTEFSEFRIFTETYLDYGDEFYDLVVDKSSDSIFLISERDPFNENLDFVYINKLLWDELDEEYVVEARHVQNYLPESKIYLNDNKLIYVNTTDTQANIPARITTLSFDPSLLEFTSEITVLENDLITISDGASQDLILLGDNIYLSSEALVAKNGQSSTRARGILVADVLAGKAVVREVLINNKVTKNHRFSQNSISGDLEVFIAREDDRNISLYKRNVATGSLEFTFNQAPYSDFFDKGSSDVFVLNPTGEYLFVRENTDIASYKINKSDFTFNRVASTTSLAGASYLTVSPDSNFLYAFGSSEVEVFQINPVNGELSLSGSSEISYQGYDVAFSSNSRDFYVMNIQPSMCLDGISRLIHYKVDQNDGSLAQSTNIEIHGGCNGGIVLSDDDSMLFVESQNGIDIYLRNLDTGELTFDSAISEYFNEQGTQNSLERIQDMIISADSSLLTIFMHNKIVNLTLVGGAYIFDQELILDSDVDLSDSGNGSYISVSADKRFAYLVKQNETYTIALKSPTEDSTFVGTSFSPITLDLGSVNYDLYSEYFTSPNLSFTASNLPSGLQISIDGIISGNLNRAALSSETFITKISVTNGVYEYSEDLSISINLSNTAPQSEDAVHDLISTNSFKSEVILQDSESDKMFLEIVTYPSNGEVSLIEAEKGRFEYRPSESFMGSDFFDYIVKDSFSESISYRHTFEVTRNDSPITIADDFQVSLGLTIELDILANDIDDGALDVSSIDILPPFPQSEALIGGLQVLPSGVILYQAPSIDRVLNGFSESFSYRAKDDLGAWSEPAKVTITISNSRPTVADDSVSTDFQTAVTIDVLSNDSDSDGQLEPASVTVSGVFPSNGEIQEITESGQIIYRPFNGFDGTDTFQYTVKDNNGAESDPATVTVTVRAQATGGSNPPPTPPPTPPSSGGGGGSSSFYLLLLLFILNSYKVRKRN